MNGSSSDSQDDNIRSLFNTLTSVENPKSLCIEPCFDIGYNASPENKGISILMTTPRAIVTETSILDIGQQNLFIASPIKSLFMDGCGTSKDCYNSPLKMGSTILSPFNDSSLSPFKSLSQSPFKGCFDEWDKDFIASFEEKLFGITDISETLDELLKSPQGKALLESKRPSLDKPDSCVARRLKISPENQQKITTKNFQALHEQSSSDMFSLPVHIKAEPTDTCTTVNTFKEENIEFDHLYGQHNRVYVNNPLTAVDPDKMSATPIKLRFTSVDNAPVRRLAMKVIGGHSTVLAGHGTAPNIGKNMLYTKPMPQSVVHDVWPVKEMLKYARLQFQEILNKAVEKEIEILKKEKRKKNQFKNIQHSKEKENVQCNGNKFVPGDVEIGTIFRSTKSKVSIKRKKKEKYPRLDKALSKPVKSHSCPKRVQELDIDEDFSSGQELHHFMFDSSGTGDLGWCPSNEDDCSDEEDVWTGSLPFHSQSSSGVFSEENEEDDKTVHVSKKRRSLKGN